MRRINDIAAARKRADTEEFKRGDTRKFCVWCLSDQPLEEFTTREYKGKHYLVARCRSCYKKPSRKLDDSILIYRRGTFHFRKPRQ